MKTGAEKTNVMRLLDAAGVAYEAQSFECAGAVSALEVADILSKRPEQVFKTLVTSGKSGAHYVFVIPAGRELDLKKAASAVGEKSIAMVKSKELLPLTGYVHGGCSPLGMKKLFRTMMDSSAKDCETILFSAGKIGFQVETDIESLKKALSFELCELTVSEP